MSVIPELQNIVIVDERTIVKAAAHFGDERNSFATILEIADEYREADMTPMFLWDIDDRKVYCVAEETFLKKLH